MDTSTNQYSRGIVLSV